MNFRKPKQLNLFQDNNPTGRECELCHLQELKYHPLIHFFLDRDVTNQAQENKALVCGPCYRHLLLAMPEGISKSKTLFAFAINRGLYSREQMTNAKSKN